MFTKKFLIGVASISLVCLLIVTGLFINQSCKAESEPEKSTNIAYFNAIKRDLRTFAVCMPESVNFAGEITPIDDFYVYEYLDREILRNTYFHSNTILWFKRAERYFPVIEPILEEYGVPDDFKYLAIAESNLQNVVSPAGAAGPWQFMRTTAISFNLEVNENIDERYNIEKATRAACEYLLAEKRRFGTWTLAAAAYNMGSGGLTNKINDQDTDNYYKLMLNSETARYVYRILSIKIIFENPDNYGFYLLKKSLYPQIGEQYIEVNTSISDLSVFAKEQNVDLLVLKMLNPWILKNKLPNSSKRTYRIAIPGENGISRSNMLRNYDENQMFGLEIGADEL